MVSSRSILFCPTYKDDSMSRVGREVANLFTQAATRQGLGAFPSGQMAVSVDEMSLTSGENHDLPDGRPVRLSRQIHFGSQCPTEGVYWHLLRG